MVEWLEMCEVTKEKLNRNLNQEEVNFLRWVYHRHVEEGKSQGREMMKAE